MLASTTQVTLPAEVAAEVIVNAAKASLADRVGTETKNLAATENEPLNVSDGISPATLRAAGIEVGISEEALNAELAKVAKKAEIYTRMQSRRNKLGLDANAAQTLFADELKLSSHCDALLNHIDEIVSAIADRGALMVGLNRQDQAIQDSFQYISTIQLNHAPYENERSQWSFLKRFFLPFSGRQPTAETVTSPALRNLIDRVQELGLGVEIIILYASSTISIAIVPQPGFYVTSYAYDF